MLSKEASASLREKSIEGFMTFFNILPIDNSGKSIVTLYVKQFSVSILPVAYQAICLRIQSLSKTTFAQFLIENIWRNGFNFSNYLLISWATET